MLTTFLYSLIQHDTLKRQELELDALVDKNVSGIVDKHGGEINVDSIVGVGSTFTFNIPVRLQE